MVLQHLPNAQGLVGIQPYSEARVRTTFGMEMGTRSQVVMIFLHYTSSLPIDFYSFPCLLSLSSCSEHQSDGRNEHLSCLSLQKHISLQGLMCFFFFFLHNQSQVFALKLPWQIPRMPDCLQFLWLRPILLFDNDHYDDDTDADNHNEE